MFNRAKKNKKNDKPDNMLTGLRKRISAHHIPIFGAAVAFFAFVALVPALVATVSITSLVADTDTLITETEAALENAPAETKDFLVAQIRSIADTGGAGVGIAAAVGIGLALFSASSAVGNLMSALNVAFDRTENRSFVTKRLTALLLLIGAVVTIVVMVTLMAVLPALLEDWAGGTVAKIFVGIGRFLGLFLLLVAAMSVLYRFGPAAEARETYELVPGGRRPLLTKGAVVGSVLIVFLSWAFGQFAQTFGSYNETYGTLAGIIVVLLWLQLISVAALVGAEVDAWSANRRVEDARVEAGLSRVPSSAN